MVMSFWSWNGLGSYPEKETGKKVTIMYIFFPLLVSEWNQDAFLCSVVAFFSSEKKKKDFFFLSKGCLQLACGSLWLEGTLCLCMRVCVFKEMSDQVSHLLDKSTFWNQCVLSSYRDLRSLGVTLVGHQKKIMNSLQEMKVQLVNGMVPL